MRSASSNHAKDEIATPRLCDAMAKEDFGAALHWPDLDEDLGVNTILGVSEEDVARAAGFTIYSSRPSEG